MSVYLFNRIVSWKKLKKSLFFFIVLMILVLPVTAEQNLLPWCIHNLISIIISLLE